MRRGVTGRAMLLVLAVVLAGALASGAAAQDDTACDQLQAGGCPLAFGQMISASLADPGKVEQWQVVADSSGTLELDYTGDPDAVVSLTNGERSVVLEPATPGPDGTIQLQVKVDPGFYQLQVAASSSGAGAPYSLLARYRPDPSRSPTLTSTESCSVSMAGGFDALYSRDATIRRRIGCPVAPERGLLLSEEAFQWGHMTWRSDTRQIVVAFGDGQSAIYDETYQDGEPQSRLLAPPGLMAPERGFGKLWRQQPDLPTSLGWALGPERGFQGAVQDFENGVMFWTGEDQLMVRVVYADGGWLLVHDPTRPG